MRLLVLLAGAGLAACGEGDPLFMTEPVQPPHDLCDAESVSIDPPGLAFGRLIPGTARTRTATLTYRGCSPATLEIETGGLFSPECTTGAFCFASPPKLELMPDESVPIEVTFHPSSTGVALGELIVSGCPTERCRAELLVQGSAVGAGIICHPDPIDFGVVSAGECAGKRIDCTNVIDRPVRIDRVWSLEESSSDLVVNAPPPVELAPDSVYGIGINYCPTDEGTDQATLIVVSSVDGRTSSVATGLSGRSGGGRLDMADSIDFGMVSLIAPARRPLRVTNGGAYWLEVFGIEVDPPFSVVLTSGASLPAGQSAHLWLQVEPISEGPIEGTAIIYSDDPVQPVQTLRIFAEGVNLPPCDLVFSDEELDFGEAPLGSVVTRNLVLSNDGQLDCMVTAASLVEVRSDFAVPDARSLTIRPGSTASIGVRFTPTATVAPSRATLEIGISNPGRPYRRVPMIGRGQ